MGQCEAAACVAPRDGALGECERQHRADGDPCDDGDACTLIALCQAGICGRDQAVDCPEPDPCTEYTGCDSEQGGCLAVPLSDGSGCDDGNDCTVADACADGVCVGEAAPDAPGCNPCNVDKDCPTPDKCAGQPSCQDGQCVTVPLGGVVCDPALAGPCQQNVCSDGECVLQPLPEATPCDDGNPCTDSVCLDGTCGIESTDDIQCDCDPNVDSSCVEFDDNDLCNGTLKCEPKLGKCVIASVLTCDDTGDPCTERVCVPDTGLCQLQVVANGTFCDDENACTLGDVCQEGLCEATAQAACGVPKTCGDTQCNPACVSANECVPDLGCSEIYLDVPCDDGQACEIEDECRDGVCSSGTTDLLCDDGNPCTADGCDPTAGCVFAPFDGECSDSDPCTVGDQCADGQCAPQSIQDCDDANPCTTDVCEPNKGCSNFKNNNDCEDGDPCTQGDKCNPQDGKCKPGANVCPCSEDAVCTQSGTCNGVWHCIANQCVLETAAATGCPDDGSPCSTVSCDPSTGTCKSELAPDGLACEDDDACAAAKSCVAGQCAGGAAIPCDDGNECTNDVCVAEVGCTYTPNGLGCDDGDPCTKIDICDGGACKGSTSVCDCKADSDCPDEPPNPCDGINRCVDNVCKLDPTTIVTCAADGLGPCLTSTCDPATGQCNVVLKPDGASCNDGDACTDNEGCKAGTCIPAGVSACDDGNVCTDDLCSPATGCTHTNNAAVCNDGNACTTSESCLLGECTGGATVCLELCDNDLDDDNDTLIDCEDPNCATQAVCDACASAPFIQCGAAGTPGAVGDAAPSQIGDTPCGSGQHADRIYRFTTTAQGPVAVTLLQGASSFGLRVLTAGESGGCDTGSCKASGSEATFTAIPEKVYHVVVEKLFLGATPSFVLSVTCTNQCVPACGDVTCGPDGCGGSCGTCNDGDPCTSDVCDEGQCISSPIEECCADFTDCDDGDLCTADTCLLGKCSYNTDPSCCKSAADCDDGLSCTTDGCSLGVCTNDPALGCCTANDQCEDDNPCTAGLCIAGQCLAVEQAGCCASDADCNDGSACTEDSCIDNACEHTSLAGCCASAADCGDGDPCTADACEISTQTCIHKALPGCCFSTLDCPPTDEPCTTLVCLADSGAAGTCIQKETANCCYEDADCMAAGPCQSAACVANQCVNTDIPACCASHDDCSDGAACTLDQCVGGDCVHLPQIGCCSVSAECDDSNPCTVDSCKDGQCAHQIVPGCCVNSGDCQDTDTCTTNVCDLSKAGASGAGTCSFVPIPACCQSAGDCQAGKCLQASCVAGVCAYEPDPGCCQNDAPDCDTSDPCVSGKCVGGKCNLTAIPGCTCNSAQDCPFEADPCKKAVCADHKCKVETVSGCCTEDAGCVAPGAPCAVVECIGNQCVLGSVPGCCSNDDQCGDPGPCAEASCVAGACESQPIDGCCEMAADCPGSEEPCSHAVCNNNTCSSATTPDCCVTVEDCSGPDVGACDVVDCVLNQCVVGAKLPGCCETVADCPAAQQKCKQIGCSDGVCVLSAIEGCCSSAADCPVAPTACSQVLCTAGTCALEAIDGCCEQDGDCVDDGNPCTATSCVGEGWCASTPIDGCCTADADCIGDGAEACTDAVCFDGACSFVPKGGCCAQDSDCPDDGDSCTEHVCLGSVCQVLPTAGCCAQDADCPEDADACTQARCVDGLCSWPAVGGCCEQASDCPKPADACVLPVCEGSGGLGIAGTCDVDALAGCAVGACVFSGFEGETATGWTLDGWAPTTAAAYYGSGSLHGQFAAGGGGATLATADAPKLQIGSEATLRFRYTLDVLSGDCDSGALLIEVLTATGASDTVWTTCLQTSEWKQVFVDLSAYQGQAITVRFVLNSGAGLSFGAALIDDVAVGGDCALTCDGACDDGNACTTDQCVAGQCTTAPVPGCCQSEAACSDDDPCTVNTCAPNGQCASAPAPGCTEGACIGDTIDGVLGVGWSLASSSTTFVFETTTVGSLSQPAHLAATGGAEDVGQSVFLDLPPALASQSGLTLRFALRQSVGENCELGRLFVVVGDVETPVHCGYHDWQTVSVAVPSAASAPVSASLRFDVYAGGPKVELDDIRLFGACHPIECQSAAECDDGDACTVGTCDVAYQCGQVSISGCCNDAADCGTPSGPCSAFECSGGACVEAGVAGCADESCWFAGFDNGFAQGWHFSAPSGAVAGVAQWGVDAESAFGPPTALHGSYETAVGEAPAVTALASLPRLLVGSGDTVLRFRYRQTLSGSSCLEGVTELWLNDELLWLSCETVDDWTQVEVALGPWVGSVVALELRLRSDPAVGAAGDVHVDDVSVIGACAEVGCASADQCDDDNPCTDDACLGFNCVYTTNQVPCDDGDACTSADHCEGGDCQSVPVVCDDDQPCTTDFCDSALGCSFVPNTLPCDDADPCSAGDTCAGGLCRGTAILCKDYNSCTQDGCTAGVGCEFEPEPFGTPCTDASPAPGTCWLGQCVGWQIVASEAAPGPTTDTRALAVAPREGPTPIHLAGTADPGGQVSASVFQLDQNTLAVSLVSDDASHAAWLDIYDDVVAGVGGAVGPLPLPLNGQVGVGLDLHAVAPVGQAWIFAGDGSSFAQVKSTARRCKLLGPGWNCSTMPIVHSPDACSKQVPFHVRDVWGSSAQTALFAGASIEDDDWVARIAVWDGNLGNDCEPLGVYSGEVYTNDPANPLVLAVNVRPPGEREVFQAVHGHSADSVWAGGEGGLVYRFNGSDWIDMSPEGWPAAAAWGPGYDVYGVHATATDVHIVGDGVGVAATDCRHGFYLHGALQDGIWVFDRLMTFGAAVADCGAPPFDHVGVRDVTVDSLTSDLYIVGWAPDSVLAPGERRGLVMRLEKP